MIASPVVTGTLPSRLAPCITATHRDWLPSSLAITGTGLSPASVVQLCWTHRYKNREQNSCSLKYSKIFPLYLSLVAKTITFSSEKYKHHS